MLRRLGPVLARRHTFLVAGAVVSAVALSLGVLTGPAEARWQASTVLSDRSHANRVPVAAGDGKGAALVAWERSPADPTAPQSVTIMMRRRDRAGHWGPRQRVSPAMQFGGSPAVAMSAHGDGVVLYSEVVSGFVNRIVVRRVHLSGRLGKARVVARGEFVSPDSVTIDGAGDIVVAWDVQQASWRVRILPAQGGRTPPAAFPAGVSALSTPQLTTRGSHQVAVAWSDSEVVHTAWVTRAGVLRDDRVVSDPADVGMPAAATPHVASNGSLVVSWYRFDTPSDARGLVAWRRLDGTVRRRVVTGRDVDVAQLMSSSVVHGRLQIGWETGGLGPAYTRSVTSRSPLGHRHRLVDGTLGVQLAGQAHGGGMITWLRGDGSGRYAVYSPTGRVLRTGRVPSPGATLTSLGRDRYLVVSLGYEPSGTATHLRANIGP